MILFKNSEEALKTLEANPLSGAAFAHLLSKSHPFIKTYLRHNGYYQDEIERILINKNEISSAYYSLRGISSEVYTFAILALCGEANGADMKKYKVWRESLPKTFQTCYIINDAIEMLNYWETIVNRLPDNFIVTGTSKTMELSFEDLIRQKPDIVVIDLVLPGMNGAEGTKILKEMIPDSACLLLTHSHSEEGMSQWAKEVGADMLSHYGPHRPSEIHALLWKTLHNFQNQTQDYSPV